MSDMISRQAAIDALSHNEPDSTWGITEQQPVCPECDSYLTRTVFISIDGTEGEKISYCDHCGQAIDWKGGE